MKRSEGRGMKGRKSIVEVEGETKSRSRIVETEYDTIRLRRNNSSYVRLIFPFLFSSMRTGQNCNTRESD